MAVAINISTCIVLDDANATSARRIAGKTKLDTGTRVVKFEPFAVGATPMPVLNCVVSVTLVAATE